MGFSFKGVGPAQDPDTTMPALLLLQTQIDQRAEAMRRWLHEAAHESPEWVGSTVSNKSTVPMTKEELGALNDALQTVLHEHTTRADQRHERGDTEGERRVRIYLDTFPLPRDD